MLAEPAAVAVGRETDRSGHRTSGKRTRTKKGRTSDAFVVPVVIEKQPGEDDYTAYSPGLPGCFSRGRTVEETQAAIRLRIEHRLEELVAEGVPIVLDQKFIDVENVTIELGPQKHRPSNS